MTSHLRRRRRATFRDVRSALAWLLTGDLSCEEVHQAREAGSSLSQSHHALLPDLAFSDGSVDYLVNEWHELDPALTIAPDTERALRTTTVSEVQAEVGRQLRRVFFDMTSTGEDARATVRAYRYLTEYIDMLASPNQSARDRILLGVSRIAGAPGYSQPGLAIGEQQPGGGWAVLKTIDSHHFTLTASGGQARFVESIPDLLTLSYRGDAELQLALDTARSSCARQTARSWVTSTRRQSNRKSRPSPTRSASNPPRPHLSSTRPEYQNMSLASRVALSSGGPRDLRHSP